MFTDHETHPDHTEKKRNFSMMNGTQEEAGRLANQLPADNVRKRMWLDQHFDTVNL